MHLNHSLQKKKTNDFLTMKNNLMRGAEIRPATLFHFSESRLVYVFKSKRVNSYSKEITES